MIHLYKTIQYKKEESGIFCIIYGKDTHTRASSFSFPLELHDLLPGGVA